MFSAFNGMILLYKASRFMDDWDWKPWMLDISFKLCMSRWNLLRLIEIFVGKNDSAITKCQKIISFICNKLKLHKRNAEIKIQNLKLEIQTVNWAKSCFRSLLKQDSPPTEGVVGFRRRLPPRIKWLNHLRRNTSDAALANMIMRLSLFLSKNSKCFFQIVIFFVSIQSHRIYRKQMSLVTPSHKPPSWGWLWMPL